VEAAAQDRFALREVDRVNPSPRRYRRDDLSIGAGPEPVASWQRAQQTIVVPVSEDARMDVDLSRLGRDEFEHPCQALTVHTLGAGVVVFGTGPDGGREASFDDRLTSFPTSSAPWTGYVVVQAKYTPQGPSADSSRLQTQVRAELDAWSNRTKARDGRRPST
jgi:hypothetical protein